MLGNVTSPVFVKLKLEALPKNANQSCKYKIDRYLFSMNVWKSQFSLSDYKYCKTIVRSKLVKKIVSYDREDSAQAKEACS